MAAVVHIGCHKTATSWFQRHVYPNVAGYRMVDRELVRSTILGPDAFAFDPATARAALGLDSLGNEAAIICDEDLSGVLHQGLVSGYIAKETAQRLHDTVPEAQIVIFVREQSAAAVSWYQQYVREGGTASIHHYLFPDQYLHIGHARPFKVPRFDFSQLDWRGLVERYDSLFGADRVIVVPYEELARDRSALLRRLGDRLGVELPMGDSRRSNASYRAGLLPLVRAANLFTSRSVTDKARIVHVPYWYTVRKALFEMLNRSAIFGKPPRAEAMLDGRTQAWIAQRFWRSNRWLAERLETDLVALGYAVDPPEREVAEPQRALPLKWMAN